MFEFSVACKYLIPRKQQLSASLIGLVSLLVITLVVWLILVFFSVTHGLEKNWIEKLTFLTAPVRITPTEAYYNSYYYQIDALSEASDYSLKTIGEKKRASQSDPYDPLQDPEIPPIWPHPDRDIHGAVKNLVGLAYQAIDQLIGVGPVQAQDFELTSSHMQLTLNRFRNGDLFSGWGGTVRSYLSYPVYLGGITSHSQHIGRTILSPSAEDLDNFFRLLPFKKNDLEEADPEQEALFDPATLQTRLASFLEPIQILTLKTPAEGWLIPSSILPEGARLDGYALTSNGLIVRIFLPIDPAHGVELVKKMESEKRSFVPVHLSVRAGELLIDADLIHNQPSQKLAARIPILLFGEFEMPVSLVQTSLNHLHALEELRFHTAFTIQGATFKGEVPFRGLRIGNTYKKSSPFWLERNQSISSLPKDAEIGEGILLPKNFRDAGVLLGDRGALSYLAPTPSLIQEQQIPVYVSGFYDPGMIPIGGKFLFVNPEVASLIRASLPQEEGRALTNGINLHLQDLSKAKEVKKQLLQLFAKEGISPYWKVETYDEFEFTKPIIQELQSQKNLFLLIAIVMIVVACSNIISMLIILVNDKKKEIGVLRSMGASSWSIGAIFGIAGGAIGLLSSVLGMGAGLLTLRYLDTLVYLLSSLQGHQMFNAAFYGEELPHEVSREALLFVIGTTALLSLMAAVIPAIKACRLNPSQVLKAGAE